MGICYVEDEEADNNYVEQGWWGLSADGKGELGDPAKYADGIGAWQCEKNKTKNATEKIDTYGTADNRTLKKEFCFEPKNYVHVGKKQEGKIWEEGKGKDMNTANKCGAYTTFIPGKNDLRQH